MFQKVRNQFIELFKVDSTTINSEEKLQSQVITWLRFPLAILVIIIHVNPQTRPIFTPIDSIDIHNLTFENIYSIIGKAGTLLGTLAVPFFFFTSGYYFFYKLKEWNINVYKNKVKKRLTTLVVPYLIWNTITLIFIFTSKTLKFCIIERSSKAILDYFANFNWGGVFWNYHIWNEGATNLLGGNIEMTGPILLPLWFLRDLIIISLLLSPVIYYGIRYLKWMFIFIVGITFLLTLTTLPGLNPVGLFFFSLGAYLSINNKNIIKYSRKWKFCHIITIVSFILCIIYDNNELKQIFYPIYRISGVISIINISALLMIKNRLKVRPNIAQTSFFVYAIHGMFILKFSCLTLAIKIIETIFIANKYSIGYLLSYIISPFLGALFCLVIFIILKMIFPRILNLLTGGRY